jgi:hypothetical protein
MNQFAEPVSDGAETTLEEPAIREESALRDATTYLADTDLPGAATAPLLPLLPPGYEELGVLGRGGMGIVYRPATCDSTASSP